MAGRTALAAALALASTLSWANDLTPGTYYRLTQPDGAQTSTVRQSPTTTGRYDVLGSSGQRKATV
jgi:hypothetical protein